METEVSLIVLNTGMELWTDHNFKDAGRAAKLRLTGNNSWVTYHNYDYIDIIEKEAKHIIVDYPYNKIDKYTFVFEEIIKRAKDISKYTFLIDKYEDNEWNIRQRLNSIEANADNINTAYDLYETSIRHKSRRIYNELIKLYMISWHRLYGIDNREQEWDNVRKKSLDYIKWKNLKTEVINYILDYGASAIMLSKGNHTIIHDYAYEGYYKNIINFKIIKIDTRYIEETELLIELAYRSNYRITPLKHHPYDGTFLMLDKDNELVVILNELLSKYNVNIIPHWREPWSAMCS